jgi:hypothetical protein
MANVGHVGPGLRAIINHQQHVVGRERGKEKEKKRGCVSQRCAVPMATERIAMTRNQNCPSKK